MNTVNSDINIILIGMPGAGKTTLGRLLAQKLGKNFIDTDLMIHDMAGKTLQGIIEERGMEGFLALEEETLLGIHARNSVISTGGSVIYSRKGMDHLLSSGLIIHLDLALEEIKRRFQDMDSRGVARAPGQTLDALFNERQPLYKRYGHIRIDCGGLSPASLVEKIVLQITAYGG